MNDSCKVRKNRWDVAIDSATVGRCNSARMIKPGDVVRCAAELARHILIAVQGMSDEDRCRWNWGLRDKGSFWLVPMSGDMKLCYPAPKIVCGFYRYPSMIERRFRWPVSQASEDLNGLGCFAVVGCGSPLGTVAERLQKTAWEMAGENHGGFFFCHDIIAAEPEGRFISFRESGLYDFDSWGEIG